jgi:hypothetical protein
MRRKIWTLGGLLVSILVLSPLLVSAEDLDVSPMSWDFGDVELGTPRSQIFTLRSLGPSAVWVYVIETTPAATDGPICAGGLSTAYCNDHPEECNACDFAVTFINKALPIELPEDDADHDGAIDVTVTFTPSAFGSREAFLYIFSNDSIDPPGMQAFIRLTGWGVDVTNPPEMMSDLLAFFNAAVTEGSLTGSGPGGSAMHRLKAFKNMLKSSSDLIEAHAYDLACSQFQDTLNRTDGLALPPDFVDGESAEELASMISEVMSALGCP